MFKKKKLKLDFYTAHDTIIEMQPMQSRTKPPSWWKEIKNSFDQFRSRVGVTVPTPTIKTCPGVVDYIRKPMTLKLWSDVIFKVKANGDVTAIEPIHNAGIIDGAMHYSDQYGDTLYPNRTVFKLHGPWAVKANFPGEYMITECHYSEDLRKHGILISPGISNFNLQHTLNAFLVFPIKDEDYTVTLKYGTPIMSLYPMHDRKFEIKMHKTDRKGFSDIQSVFPSTFIGRYYTGKHALKN